MYGNTHRIAEAIARGLRPAYVVQVVSVAGARHEHVGCYDLIVAGGPTHAHGMSRPDTREAAISAPVKAERLKVEPDAAGVSLRVWLDGLGLGSGHPAAFDTRLQGYAFVTGRASGHRCHAASAWVGWWLNRSVSSWIDTITFYPVRRSGRSVGVPPWARNG